MNGLTLTAPTTFASHFQHQMTSGVDETSPVRGIKSLTELYATKSLIVPTLQFLMSMTHRAVQKHG
jgi:hypothetical protein